MQIWTLIELMILFEEINTILIGISKSIQAFAYKFNYSWLNDNLITENALLKKKLLLKVKILHNFFLNHKIYYQSYFLYIILNSSIISLQIIKYIVNYIFYRLF